MDKINNIQEDKKSLMDRIGENKLKYFSQLSIVPMVFCGSLGSTIDLAEKINRWVPNLEETIGSIPYTVSKVGVVGAGVIGGALLTYVATKGAGMWFDEYWYKPKQK